MAALPKEYWVGGGRLFQTDSEAWDLGGNSGPESGWNLPRVHSVQCTAGPGERSPACLDRLRSRAGDKEGGASLEVRV